jgi:hypothetical protein
MRILRQLNEDGLEDLGTLTLPSTVVIGDPGEFGAPTGTGRWFGGTVRSGTWFMFGRPWTEDADRLEELVLVHESALPTFYETYDELLAVASLPLPHQRVVVLAGGLHKDTEILRSLVEPEELPWVMDDRGVVAAGIAEFPAQVAASRGSPVSMIAIGLARPPEQSVPTAPYTAEDREPEES